MTLNFIPMKKSILLSCFYLLIAQLANAQTDELWGMTTIGGQNNGGIIFKIDIGGNAFDTVYSFKTDTIGGGDSPQGDLYQAPNGKLYGTTLYGGGNSGGTIFSYDINDTTYTDVHDFDNATGYQSNGSLIAANNEYLYGMAGAGGAHNFGVIFRLNPDSNTYKDVYDFDSINGSYPYGNLLQASDGQLYGMTSLGGDSDAGVIFSFDPTANSLNKLYDFKGSTGIYPNASLIQIASKLYGVTSYGGANSAGALFSFDIDTHIFSKLYDFNYGTGYAPEGNLTLVNGLFYGTTYNGGTYSGGVIFSYDTLTNTYNDLFNFNDTLGQYPPASLLLASDDNLYGMTQRGGKDSMGIIFSFNSTDSNCNDLFNFYDSLGEIPNGNLIETGTTGIEQLAANNNQLSIYPNPTSNQLTIINKQSSISEIRVTNIMGQVIYTFTLPQGQFSTQINVSDLPSGLYFVSVTSNNQIITNKISIISK